MNPTLASFSWKLSTYYIITGGGVSVNLVFFREKAYIALLLWTGISWKGSTMFLICWVHSSSLNNFRMDWDKLSLLSFIENLEYLWLFEVGLMEKSLWVLEWQLFEKKCAKNKFLVHVKKGAIFGILADAHKMLISVLSNKAVLVTVNQNYGQLSTAQS